MKFAETDFLSRLFAELEKVPYAVLRHAETLPDTVDGSDIDMLVGQSGIPGTVAIIETAARASGGRILARMTAPHFSQLELLGRDVNGWWGCCIDLFDGVYCQSVLPLVGNELLERRVRTDKGIWTVDEERGQYLGFAKELLVNNTYSKRYEEGARRALVNAKDDFLLSEDLRRTIAMVLQGKSVNLRSFRFQWKMKMVFSHPLRFARDWFGFLWSRVARVIRPAGKMIAVMGTDGAGKTTLLNAIMPVIQLATHKATVVHHLKPDLLPPLGRLRGVKYEPGHVCTNPHGSKPSGTVGSLIRITYLTLDYVFGYWLKVRIKLAKTPIPFWIFDRYAYDMLMDPRRFRIQLPSWLIGFFTWLAPRPDILICLGGDPEKIFARKPETSLAVVRQQVKQLQTFCRCHGGYWVDTTGTVEDSVCEIMRVILAQCRRS